jgi:hypothetical protein
MVDGCSSALVVGSSMIAATVTLDKEEEGVNEVRAQVGYLM